MKKIRLPRKTKKKLKKGAWFYPADQDGNSVMARPTENQDDYTALKKGIVQNLFDRKENNEENKDNRKLLNKPDEIPDSELRSYIDDILREDIRQWAFNKLSEAKQHPNTILAYYNFVNAYKLYRQGKNEYGNICCLALDYAQTLLKKQRKQKQKSK